MTQQRERTSLQMHGHPVSRAARASVQCRTIDILSLTDRHANLRVGRGHHITKLLPAGLYVFDCARHWAATLARAVCYLYTICTRSLPVSMYPSHCGWRNDCTTSSQGHTAPQFTVQHTCLVCQAWCGCLGLAGEHLGKDRSWL